MKDYNILYEALKSIGALNDYVYLRHDYLGYYLEYAYMEGKPEHCRCIKYQQLTSLKKYFPDDAIYRISEVTCGLCKVGHPKNECKKTGVLSNIKWTEVENHGCACWELEPLPKNFNLFDNYDLNSVPFIFDDDTIAELVDKPMAEC